MAGREPEHASRAWVHRTIPDSRYRLAVDASGASISLGAITAVEGPNTATAQDLRGRTVYLRAVGGDITIMRGATGPASIPAAAGAGWVVDDARLEPQRFFVDREGAIFLGARAGSALSLDIMWDSEIQ